MEEPKRSCRAGQYLRSFKSEKILIDIRHLFAYNDCFHCVGVQNVLNVSFHNHGTVLSLRCSARVTPGEMDEIVCAAVRQHAREVILEVSEVSAIDAAAIAALLALQAAGIYPKLLNPTVAVREALRLTKTERVFEICESRAAVRATELSAAASLTVSH